ncbi:uncharacterized protein LOC113777279 [Coffea eugenioides]|uniref:uncharacterized protein LOC113777279 n=1 Tax=Coffea eugenioides TaxID=49369 RepID=UPI000F615B38|nr:uncharacterized protein LOC113777279 [Coffea eugenioides]
MHRSSRIGELIFDPEVEKTVRRTRKETRQLREEQSSVASQGLEPEVESMDLRGDNSSDSDQEEVTMTNAQILRELAAPNLNQQPLCITFPSLNDNTPFELKSGLIHLLPSFHGLPGEERYKHLQEFDVVCNSMKPPGIIKEQIKMRAFPFSLKDSAKDWLYYLPPAWELIEGIVENSQQFGTREDVPIRKVNEVDTSSIQQQLTKLTSFVRQLAVGNASQAKVCGICTTMGHSTDMCPMIQEESAEQNVSAMTLRSGKEIQGSELTISKDKDEERIDNELEKEDNNGTNQKVLPDPVITVRTNPPPFPNRLEKPRKQDKEKEILEVFRKVEINIPLLDAIKQVPKYAKFLRDLCVNRQQLKGDERVIVGENVSAVLQRKFPPKCGDLGRFTVPCTIGNTLIKNTLLDLGASINVMPKSMYASLNLGPLKEIEIIIQLANRTNAYPDGLVKDVLVKINELIFPADFYVLDMDDDHSLDPSSLL